MHYGLSPLQAGLLFESVRGDEGDVYVTQDVFRLRGDVSVDALAAAWISTVEAYDVLRTGFEWRGLEEPRQVVRERVAAELAIESAASGKDATGRLVDWVLRRERAVGFDLEQPPLFRPTLVHAGSDNRLILTWHHLVLDGWSRYIILRSWIEEYVARMERTQSRTLSPPQYHRYIEWLDSREDSRAAAAWRTELGDLRAPLVFERRSEQRRAEGVSHEIYVPLDDALCDELRVFTRHQHVTLATIFTGALAMVLRDQTGRRWVRFGSTVSVRPDDLGDPGELVGLFINTIPLQLHVDQRARVGDWLRQLQARQARMRDWAHASLTNIRDWCAWPTSEPIFDVVLALENFPRTLAPAASNVGLELEFERTVARTQFALSINVVLAPRASCVLRYAPSAVGDLTASRIAGRLRQVLESVVRNPTCHLDELDCLPDEERRVLSRASGNGRGRVSNPNVLDVIEAQARAAPDRIAARSGDEQLTYGALRHASDSVAEVLRSLAVQPEMRVAILLYPGIHLPTAVVGVLKAGAAYVPLDPDDPPGRLARLIKDAGAGIVITDERAEQFVPRDVRSIVLPVDDCVGSSSRDGRAVSRDALAYVIYTSGSTGIPKGVMVSRSSVDNLISWIVGQFELTRDDKMLLQTPPVFDASVWDILAPLAVGAELVVPVGAPRDLASIADSIESAGVTVVHAVPSLLEALVEERGDGIFGNVRLIAAGGERLDTSLSRRLVVATRGRVVNMYGPTEACVKATYFWVCARAGQVPIGRPIRNARVYVLDSDLRQLPIGVAGELYIGGAGVARGYIGDPMRTAEFFVPDPFSVRGGERLYRTGDHAHLADDGELEFLGRVDDQVKIRGVRMELGEIEAAVLRHPRILRAAAALDSDARGGPALVVGYIGIAENDPSPELVRTWLAKQLPLSRIPTTLVALSRLPTGRTGKLDRAQLVAEAKDVSTSRRSGKLGDLVGCTESVVAKVWADVLGVPAVGRFDDFFDLNGHSLHAMRITSRLEREGFVGVPLRLIFDRPLLSEFAAALDEITSSGPS